MSIYNLKSLDATRFMIAKFDEDFNVLSTYTLTPAERGQGYSCDCPANQRSVITKLCRHRRMLPLMLGAVNTDRFYDPDTGAWCEPLGDMHRVPSEEPEAQPEVTLIDDTGLGLVGEAVPLAKPEVEGEALGSSASTRTCLEEAHRIPAIEVPGMVIHDVVVGHASFPLPKPASPLAPTIRRR